MTLKLINILIVTWLSTTYARDWWENANYYQIYPKSYADSDNDGTGDLNGISEKIPYLKELGMDAVWLSPCFKSTWKDGGYDISDFFSIDPIFGTMEDFDYLVEVCHENGVKLILDFVPNHSSNENEWFIKSEKKETGFEDFYIWHAGKPNPGGGQNLPPNNWNSVFRGSAWEWSETRKEYYLHQFAIAQPDLNYRNPLVVEEMKKVLRFWLDKGVDGFRVDAIPHLFEVEKDQEGNYPDEPLSGNCEDPSMHCYLNHIYTQNYDETYDMVYQWRDVLDSYKNGTRIMMTEAYTSLENLMKYYGDGKKNGSHMPFNFEVLMAMKKDSTAKTLKDTSENYMKHLPAGHSGNWVLGNHDQRRIYNRLGENRADLYNIFLQTMPGHAITYQGEEIVMQDVKISWNDTQDPQACNAGEEVYDDFSRDPARTPMQWNSERNGGFNKNTKTWLPMGDFKNINVNKQEEEENSHLKIFKKLVQLHKLDAFRDGSYVSGNSSDENIYSYIREGGNETYLVVLNFAKQNKTVNFANHYTLLKPHADVVVASLNSYNIKENDHIHVDEDIVLSPETGFVAKLSGATTAVVSFITLLATIVLTFFRNCY